MRIISQNGTLDVPYEQTIISRANDTIYGATVHGETIGELAEYSTEEKADRVMAEMRVRWNKGKHIYKFPADNEL